MYSDQLAELPRGTLRRLLEDLEAEGAQIRETYAAACSDLLRGAADWTAEHAVAVAARDAGLSRVKGQQARVSRALEDQAAAKREAKAARKGGK